jgi:hypothetical protein
MSVDEKCKFWKFKLNSSTIKRSAANCARDAKLFCKSWIARGTEICAPEIRNGKC